LDRLSQAVARSARRSTTLSVLFLDLDGFKAVNDTLGHDAGDDLLRSVSHRLAGCVRAEETVARLGGDEFTILLEDVDEDITAIRVAERVAEAICMPFVVRGHDVSISASIGIAMGRGGEAPDELLRRADAAMYLAKRSGKDHELYSDETEPRLDALRDGAARIRVLLADDTASIRTLLRFQLELDGDCVVVGEACDGAQAVAMAAELRPDIVLLDLAMPVMDGLEALPAIREVAPRAKVVVLSGFESAQMAEDAFFLGADAYLEKGAESEDIVALVKAQMRAGDDFVLPAPRRVSDSQAGRVQL
jgi:diguanylate cyclase (GGDEF)-like protein